MTGKPEIVRSTFCPTLVRDRKRNLSTSSFMKSLLQAGYSRRSYRSPLWKRTETESYNFPQGRRAMSLRKLCLFILAATIAGFATVKPNTLVRFDPKSESFSTKQIPSGGGVVRNMVATPDRRLYLACSGVNKVAVVDLK
jgi:hypothetical protein